ncbi:hypothetical protein EDC04DRAFT_2606631 [Pisolithus marmoratus]|nr:hypothetical protein EDC04DRAFT_2606631 [Pisolithus marmoratus]
MDKSEWLCKNLNTANLKLPHTLSSGWSITFVNNVMWCDSFWHFLMVHEKELAMTSWSALTYNIEIMLFFIMTLNEDLNLGWVTTIIMNWLVCLGPLSEASFGLPEIGGCLAHGLLLAKIPLIHLCACLTMATATVATALVSLQETAPWLYSELDSTSWSHACTQCCIVGLFWWSCSTSSVSPTEAPQVGHNGGNLDLVISKGKVFGRYLPDIRA